MSRRSFVLVFILLFCVFPSSILSLSFEGGYKHAISRLVRVYHYAIPPSLVDRMLPEINRMSDYEASLPSLKDSKRRTRWFEFTKKKPSILLEEVVRRLSLLAKPSHRVTGGEWWIQRVGQTEPIGFHIDKDESIASLQQRMVVPEWSSVFYVTDVGGGTLITDQQSPNGNGYHPFIPEHGALSIPKKNKYLLFNGTLLHGVLKGKKVPTVNSPRFTFLVNYWPAKPDGPNCEELSYDDLPSLTRFHSDSEYEAFKSELDAEMNRLFRMKASDADDDRPRYGVKDKLTFIDLSNADQEDDQDDKTNITESYLFTMELPGKRRQSVYVPKKSDLGKTYHILWKKSPESEKKAEAKKKAAQAKKHRKKFEEEEEEEENEEEEEEEEEEELPKKKSKKSKKSSHSSKKKQSKGKKGKRIIDEEDDEEEGSIYDRYVKTKRVDTKQNKRTSSKSSKRIVEKEDDDDDPSDDHQESSDDDDEEEEEVDQRKKRSSPAGLKENAHTKTSGQKAIQKNTAKKGTMRDEL